MVRLLALVPPPQEGRFGGPQPPKPCWHPVVQKSSVEPQKL
jgi:hypothetical protein